MTEQEIADPGPAFSRYLSQYRSSFGQARTAAHFDTSCRGLLTDLPRKSVEPIALQSGTAVRTLQEFLVTSKWDDQLALATLRRRVAQDLAETGDGGIGTVGLIDETSCRKWGDQTPGAQRQYLGCVGKVEHGIVTVHVGVAKGTYSALSPPTCTCRSPGLRTGTAAGRPASPTPCRSGRSGGSRRCSGRGCGTTGSGSTG